jgi:hypothetical protein
VLLVDADGQENLTQTFIGQQVDREFAGDYAKFFEANHVGTLYDAIEYLRYEGTLPRRLPSPLRLPLASATTGELHLLPGHTALSEWGEFIVAAEATMESFPVNKNLPGAPMSVIQQVARSVQAEIVIIDLNPAMSAFNRCIWWGCDYYLTPCMPDILSLKAFERLEERLSDWHIEMTMNLRWTSKATATPILKETPPVYLGAICGRVPANPTPAETAMIARLSDATKALGHSDPSRAPFFIPMPEILNAAIVAGHAATPHIPVYNIGESTWFLCILDPVSLAMTDDGREDAETASKRLKMSPPSDPK